MKVIGLGSPDDVRVRFDAREVDVLVDVLRDLRAKATRDAADTYATTPPRETRPIDDRHDRLRGLEGLLLQLEEQPPDNRPGAILIGDTTLLRDVVRAGAREALKRLQDAHERYEDRVTSRSARRWSAPPRPPRRGSRRSPPSSTSIWAGTHDASQPRPAPARARVVGVRQPPARKLPNLTAARAVRALEVLAFHPASAPGLAATMGIHDRTARRLLHTLEDEGYLQRGHGTFRQRHTYSVTPRLLALAGQLAARQPLVVGGERAVRNLHESTGLDAYLVIPSYGDVIVLARAGDQAPTRWSLLPATNSAGPIR